MANIFENAYFGKAYKARNGEKAIYVTDKHFVKNKHSHTLVFENGDIELYSDEGRICFGGYGLDIISEWSEEINKEELDAYAEGFKAGYRLAFKR